jgi:hypothetical protein
MIIGGSFDRQGGKPSKIIQELAAETGWAVRNGGRLEDISALDFKKFDVLLWMPNIDNAEEKILPAIKDKNPKLLLISSKRVVEKKYHEMDVIGRLLKTRSNLGVMIEKTEKGDYNFKLLDPLGNQFCNSASVKDLAQSMAKRVGEIRALTRIGSLKIGDEKPSEVDPDFVAIVRDLGDEFSRHVNAINPERFLGNASTRRTTRCCHGFPAQRTEDTYMISRRNVDKQTMGPDDFVHVRKDEDAVRYYGDKKPSVDSPIQIRLFNRYANVNYIVHGHVYIDGAPVTDSKVPCGHVEEFNEIAKLAPDASASNFAVNLKGHGCLILAKDTEYLKKLKFKGRPFPET